MFNICFMFLILSWFIYFIVYRLLLLIHLLIHELLLVFIQIHVVKSIYWLGKSILLILCLSFLELRSMAMRHGLSKSLIKVLFFFIIIIFFLLIFIYIFLNFLILLIHIRLIHRLLNNNFSFFSAIKSNLDLIQVLLTKLILCFSIYQIFQQINFTTLCCWIKSQLSHGSCLLSNKILKHNRIFE